MTRRKSVRAVLFVLLSSVCLAPGAARADLLYSFTGEDAVTSVPYSFSFTEPALFTTSGAFSASFEVGGAAFTSAYFDAPRNCYTFSTSQATDCSFTHDDNNLFFTVFGDAPAPGTFQALGEGCETAADAQPCVFAETLTISSMTAATPEPASWMLLGTGLMGVAGAVRRRLA